MSLSGKENVIRLSEFGNFSDGKKNAFEALKKCFAITYPYLLMQILII